MKSAKYRVTVKGKPDFETMCYYQAKFISLMENGIVMEINGDDCVVIIDNSEGKYEKTKRQKAK